MDELKIDELEKIPIPEGLEERLSMKIDEWEQAEKEEVDVSSYDLPSIKCIFTIVCSFSGSCPMSSVIFDKSSFTSI